jgi:hypothetical protein
MVANGPAMKAAHSVIRKPESIANDQSFLLLQLPVIAFRCAASLMRFYLTGMRKPLKDIPELTSILGIA